MLDGDDWIPGIPGNRIFSLFFGIGTSITKLELERNFGTGIGKIWYWKKSQNRYGKICYGEKVLEPVSEEI